jgi:hypothetical protein
MIMLNCTSIICLDLSEWHQDSQTRNSSDRFLKTQDLPILLLCFHQNHGMMPYLGRVWRPSMFMIVQCLMLESNAENSATALTRVRHAFLISFFLSTNVQKRSYPSAYSCIVIILLKDHCIVTRHLCVCPAPRSSSLKSIRYCSEGLKAKR